MNLIDRIKKMPLGIKIACSAAVVAVLVAVIVVIVLSRNGYVANTMRLLRVEGTVTIEDSKGGTKPVIDNIRFQSGDALSTGSDGLASVGLDDTKIITLQSDSRAEFTKQGKHLELKLTKGAVFFNVTEKLQPDETFEIKTSTMTAGIRGTSGIVYYDEESNRDALIVTDGSVVVTATNPDTGETKYAEVKGGERIQVFLYSDRKEDTVQFYLDEITEEDLSDFTLEMLVENDELLNRVCEYTGWDKEKLKSFVNDVSSGKVIGQVITLTPTPTLAVTPTTSTSPTPTVTVTPTPSPTDNPNASPTPVPDPDPNATSTPTPTVTVTPTPSATVTPTATATPTATPKATPTPATYKGHSIKEGCEPTEVWGLEFDGILRYVCYDADSDKYYGYAAGSDSWFEVGKLGDNRGYQYLDRDSFYYLADEEEYEIDYEYLFEDEPYEDDNGVRNISIRCYYTEDEECIYEGLVNGEWVQLDYYMSSSGYFINHAYYYKGEDTLYYTYSEENPGYTAPHIDEPEVKSGCSKTSYWGKQYNGNMIYICEDSSGNSYGYVNDGWVLLDTDSVGMPDGVVFMIDGTDEEYFSYSWGVATSD